jgi:hypothetical protein
VTEITELPSLGHPLTIDSGLTATKAAASMSALRHRLFAAMGERALPVNAESVGQPQACSQSRLTLRHAQHRMPVRKRISTDHSPSSWRA